MKKIFGILSISIIIALIGCSGTSGNSKDETKGIIKFKTFNSYFVKNNYVFDSTGAFVFANDTAEFNKIFGAAAVMGGNQEWINPADFSKQFCIAIMKGGKSMFNLSINEIKVEDDILKIYFISKTISTNNSFTGNSLILAMVDCADFKSIQFISDDKVIKELPASKKCK